MAQHLVADGWISAGDARQFALKLRAIDFGRLRGIGRRVVRMCLMQREISAGTERDRCLLMGWQASDATMAKRAIRS